MQFTRNRAGEQEVEFEEKKPDLGKNAAKGHCRFCKADDHWSVACPYKVIFEQQRGKSRIHSTQEAWETGIQCRVFF